MDILIHVIGWTGSLMVILAYGLNSYQRLTSDSYAFLILNLVGGTFLIIYTSFLSAFASTFINVVWVVIAIPALVRRVRKVEIGK